MILAIGTVLLIVALALMIVVVSILVSKIF